MIERLCHPTPRQRILIALGVALFTLAYLAFTAWQQDRDLIPKFHDEHMHLLQMRHLAHGRLWLPALPPEIRDHFETFHVFVEPVYASIYFPGTALMYLPAVWFNLPTWLLPMFVAAACCAMLYRVVTEVLDGQAGLLAAMLLLSLQWFRYLAMMVMSHSVMLLLGLLLIWSWLHWRRKHSISWSLAIGAFAGWAAITRPVDAIVYALPIGVVMLIDLRKLPIRRAAQLVACIIASALPFLTLQIIEDIGITGSPFKTPYRLYADLFTPQMSLGFHQFDPSIRPRTMLAQRQDYYDEFTVPAAAAHRPGAIASTWWRERLPLLAKVTLPNHRLWWFVPFGLVAAYFTRARLVIAAILPIYIAFYATFAYLLPWYCIVIAPSVIFLVILGAHAITHFTPPPYRNVISAIVGLAIISAAVAAQPGIDKEAIDDGFVTPTMWFSYVEAPKAVKQPAIILFRYAKGDNINEEPAYNVDAMTPDDAPIIRAHDLGPARNQKLFAYYAARQPRRDVYLFDRKSRTFTPLGNVGDLAKPSQ